MLRLSLLLLASVLHATSAESGTNQTSILKVLTRKNLEYQPVLSSLLSDTDLDNLKTYF